MRFRRLHIDGYGVWRDLVLDELSEGLNVFVAPNEGGKSTLMSFIRAVLFGFKRRSDPQRYEPLNGGRHGGFVELDADGRAFRISRLEGTSSRGDLTVLDEQGADLGAARLDALLCGTTETLYENVFAFGLDELQRLDTLHADEVAGHIYAAGMGAGKLTPVAFRAQVQAGLEGLYRPRGQKQPVAKLLGLIEGLEERIERLRQLPDQHGELTRQYGHLAERLRAHDRALGGARDRLDRAQRAFRAWEPYRTLLSAESTLETIGVSLERVQAQRAASDTRPVEATAGSSHAAISHAGAGGAVAVETVADAEVLDPVDLMSSTQRRLLHQSNQIRGLQATSGRLRELRTELLELQREARTLRHELFNELQSFGDGWSLERIRAARTDVTARDEIRQWQQRLDRASSDIESAEARARDANLVYEALRENREQIGRGTLIVSWGLILLAVVLTAVLVPAEARLVSTASIVSVGGLLGLLVTWLHTHGLRQRRAEQAEAAAREAELWHQHDEARETYELRLREWRAWCTRERLPTEVSTDGALDLLERVRQVQATDQQAQEAETVQTRKSAELHRVCMDVLSVLEDIDRQVLDLRYDALKMVDPLLSTIEGLQAELTDVEEHRERVRRAVDDHAQARATLRALAADEGLHAFRRRLESSDPDRLAAGVGEAQAAVAEAQADRDAVNESIGALREQLRALETDTQLPDQLAARENHRAGLVERVEAWAAHALAAALYDIAKGKYEAERQPQLLRLASQYFETMTDGRYSRVIAPLGESRVEAERADTGLRLPTTALSRGTAEQLYLSMRLALAKVYGQQATTLPLVADDILVNFDDDRARATVKVLESLAAEGTQILAFTCHRHLAVAFERHAPAAQVRSLPAHG